MRRASSGRIILLNGTSSSGKTSLIKALQTLPDVWLEMGIDRFTYAHPGGSTARRRGPSCSDTFARTEGCSGWRQVLDQAKPLSKLAVEHVCDGLDLRVVEMQVAAGQRARDLLQQIEKAPMYRHSLRLALEASVGIPLE